MRRIHPYIIMVTVIALTMIGFGHRPMAPAAQAQAAAYVLAGGSWTDLCGDAQDPTAHNGPCMACVISSGCDFPTASGAMVRLVSVATIAWPDQTITVPATRNTAAHLARAPPTA